MNVLITKVIKLSVNNSDGGPSIRQHLGVIDAEPTTKTKLEPLQISAQRSIKQQIYSPNDDLSGAIVPSESKIEAELNTDPPVEQDFTPLPDLPAIGITPPQSEVDFEGKLGQHELQPHPSEASLADQAYQHNLKTEENLNGGAIASPDISTEHDGIDTLWILYTSNLAKQCKSKCPMVRSTDVTCKCQAKSDRVLSDLETLVRNADIADIADKIWPRLSENMESMFNHFWEEHTDDERFCPPSCFEFGYEGLKLVQSLKKEELSTERERFGKVLEFQFRAPLDAILSEDCILGALVHGLSYYETSHAQRLRLDLGSQGWYMDLQ